MKCKVAICSFDLALVVLADLWEQDKHHMVLLSVSLYRAKGQQKRVLELAM